MEFIFSRVFLLYISKVAETRRKGTMVMFGSTQRMRVHTKKKRKKNWIFEPPGRTFIQEKCLSYNFLYGVYGKKTYHTIFLEKEVIDMNFFQWTVFFPKIIANWFKTHIKKIGGNFSTWEQLWHHKNFLNIFWCPFFH